MPPLEARNAISDKYHQIAAHDWPHTHPSDSPSDRFQG